MSKRTKLDGTPFSKRRRRGSVQQSGQAKAKDSKPGKIAASKSHTVARSRRTEGAVSHPQRPFIPQRRRREVSVISLSVWDRNASRVVAAMSRALSESKNP